MTEDRAPTPTGADVRASSGDVLPSPAQVGPIEALADSLVGIRTNPPDGLYNARHVARRLRHWGYVLERVER